MPLRGYMHTHKFMLSDGAQAIFKEVLDAMQNAEEIGGVASKADYVSLMTSIIQECSKRIDTCVANTAENV